jgi:hypothetical protein
MNVRIRLAIVATLFSTPFLAIGRAEAASLSLQDSCGRSTSGTASKTDPNASVVTADQNGGLTITDYSGSYAAIGDCQTSTSKPVCALSASNTKVTKGSTVTLFAKCTSPTDTITWNSPAGSPTLNPVSTFAKTVTLSSSGAYTYTIIGTSTTYGTGGPSSPVTILVGNDAAAGSEDKPNCVLTVSPAWVEITQSATISAVCQPEAASYTWDAVDPNAPAAPSSTTASASPTFANVGTYTYAVSGNGTPGTGPKASATITVGTGINFRGWSSKTSTGTLAFPTGTQSSDWLALYIVSSGTFTTPTGWNPAATRALTNYPGFYVNLFTRQAGTDTGVSIGSNTRGIIVAYQGGSGFGAAATFVESAPSGGNCALSATRQTAGGVVISFFSDADSVAGSLPSGYASRVTLTTGSSVDSIAERFYGSTGTSSVTWLQGGAASHSAFCTLIELKR